MKNWIRTQSGDMLHVSTLKKVYSKQDGDSVSIYAKDDDMHMILKTFAVEEMAQAREFLDQIFAEIINLGAK